MHAYRVINKQALYFSIQCPPRPFTSPPFLDLRLQIPQAAGSPLSTLGRSLLCVQMFCCCKAGTHTHRHTRAHT